VSDKSGEEGQAKGKLPSTGAGQGGDPLLFVLEVMPAGTELQDDPYIYQVGP
jgi:hypothetical protein